jgi:hypothetical protein
MWVYVRSEPGLWTVGFFDPDGRWHSDSDHSEREDAAARVAFLNGKACSPNEALDALALAHQRLEKRFREHVATRYAHRP